MTDLLLLAERVEGAEEALAAAVRQFAAIEQSYRNPHGDAARRMSKQNRQSMAARYAQWARDLEAVSTAAARARHLIEGLS